MGASVMAGIRYLTWLHETGPARYGPRPSARADLALACRRGRNNQLRWRHLMGDAGRVCAGRVFVGGRVASGCFHRRNAGGGNRQYGCKADAARGSCVCPRYRCHSGKGGFLEKPEWVRTRRRSPPAGAGLIASIYRQARESSNARGLLRPGYPSAALKFRCGRARP